MWDPGTRLQGGERDAIPEDHMEKDVNKEMDENVNGTEQETGPGTEQETGPKTELETETMTEAGGASHGKADRVFAVIGLLIMAVLVVWFLICLVTGSDQTLAVMVTLILYSVILYLFLWLRKVFSK